MARLGARIVLAAGAGVLLLAGCADPVTGPGAAGPASGATGTPPFATPAPVPSSGSTVVVPPPVDPTGLPTARGKPVTVDGIVQAGVEPGCRVLVAGPVQYLILGGTDVPLGVPVRVRGVLQPGVLSTCQQGTPLRVTDVQRR